jgi:hypothetical protein
MGRSTRRSGRQSHVSRARPGLVELNDIVRILRKNVRALKSTVELRPPHPSLFGCLWRIPEIKMTLMCSVGSSTETVILARACYFFNVMSDSAHQSIPILVFADSVLGIRPYDWQCKILLNYEAGHRTAAACANNTGKTSTIFPICALWTLWTREEARVQYITASGDQLKHQFFFLYPPVCRTRRIQRLAMARG